MSVFGVCACVYMCMRVCINVHVTQWGPGHPSQKQSQGLDVDLRFRSGLGLGAGEDIRS